MGPRVGQNRRPVTTRPHRILFLHTAPGIPLGGRAGGGRHLRDVIRAMARAGHDVLVIARRLTRSAGDAPPELPCRVLHFPQPSLPGVLRRVPVVDETVYDRRVALFARQAVAGRWRPTLIYERHSLLSTAGVALARTLGVPAVLEVNAPLRLERARHEGLRDGLLVRRTERRTLRRATRLIAVSTGVRDHLVAAGVSPARIRVVPNGVDTALFAPRPRPSADADGALAGALAPLRGRFVLVFCGTLKPWHDLGPVLEAMAGEPALGRTALLVVGDGPGRGALERRAGELGIRGRVVVTGLQPEDRVPELMARADVALVPAPATDDHYVSPLKLLEAMAMGLPVVATDLGDVGRVAGGDDPAALLVPPADAGALAAALVRLLDDAPLRRALGGAGLRRARAHTWDHVVERSLEGL